MKLSIPSRNFSCEIREGETLLAALARSGVSLSAPCGGRGLCGKCGVISGGKTLLACRTIPSGDISIELPADAIAGIQAPDLRGRTGGTETVEGRAGEAGTGKGSRAVKRIGRAGVGVDIGTTTVSAELVDLDTGETAETVSALNDQRIFGADVMSRIEAARKGKTAELFSLINRQIETMLRSFIETYRLPKIERVSVSGNTVMLHLFANADPSAMGEIPFTPVFLEERRFRGRGLSLSADDVYLLPGIAAFVGGDIVSGLAVLDVLNLPDKSLFIDIGTNGEMALWSGGRVLCCSTAAGPAFEGAEISCGMGALPGAINKVTVNGESGTAGGPDGSLRFTTIDNRPPRGICGCGLIDALAVMLKTGAIDETGALADGFEDGWPLWVSGGIGLSGRDVRQYQLAKSAIRSGITLLCAAAGLKPGELDAVYIAGGLGFFIDLENAIATGILPEEFRGKTAVCGNLSLRGAVLSLTRDGFAETCRRITEKSETLELASDPGFMEAFAENMLF
ncbi:MAG: ASKHA domain-containing protein [Treponema sp.]|jgi:uncharacterized 2Fe-2S/4Fe-4S cluster protein (DUF4445 family)|nr:ASKHA domain-containing protein [Treponema sp.]